MPTRQCNKVCIRTCMVFKQQKDITRDLSMVPMRTGCILHGRRVPRPATYDMDSAPTMSANGVPLTGFDLIGSVLKPLFTGMAKGTKNRIMNTPGEGNEGGIEGGIQKFYEEAKGPMTRLREERMARGMPF